MSAKIIELSAYRSGVKVKNGVLFPGVYRLEGFLWDDGLTASNTAAPLHYTLTPEDSGGLANASWTPIGRLDSDKDAGWLIVRHHMQRAFIEGYLDALTDGTNGADSQTGRTVYQTKEGLFTLLHREAVQGAPNNLLIYITKVQMNEGPFAGEWVDSWYIVHPDGTVTDDIDPLLYPDEED